MDSHKTKEKNKFLYETGKDGEIPISKLARLLRVGCLRSCWWERLQDNLSGGHSAMCV